MHYDDMTRSPTAERNVINLAIVSASGTANRPTRGTVEHVDYVELLSAWYWHERGGESRQERRERRALELSVLIIGGALAAPDALLHHSQGTPEQAI